MSRGRADHYPDSSKLVYWYAPSILNLPAEKLQFHGVELNVIDPGAPVKYSRKQWWRGWRLFLAVPEARWKERLGMMHVVFQRRLYSTNVAPPNGKSVYQLREYQSRELPKSLGGLAYSGYTRSGSSSVEWDNSAPEGVDAEMFELHFAERLWRAFNLSWDWAERQPLTREWYYQYNTNHGNARLNPRRRR